MFSQYKPFFLFLSKFLLFYIVFAFLYGLYLKQFDVEAYEVDGVTKVVAHHTVSVLKLANQEAHTYLNDFEPSMKLFFKEKYVARIIEGCNAISVIILFAAFVFAFSNGIKKTLLYIVFGSIVIYGLNVIRIALLAYALYYYPEQETLLHELIFPLFIYGVVFLLWVFWVTKLSGHVLKK